MRTTLTIDDDVAAALRRIAARRNTSLKSVVNEALRCGLTAMSQPARRHRPYRFNPLRGGVKIAGIASTSELLALAEDDDQE